MERAFAPSFFNASDRFGVIGRSSAGSSEQIFGFGRDVARLDDFEEASQKGESYENVYHPFHSKQSGVIGETRGFSISRQETPDLS
jgi:hypothetical protein